MAEPRPEAVPQRAVLDRTAMEHANLPSLVAVLYQLTGDRRYLADPYRPTRSRGMEDNDPGGFARRGPGGDPGRRGRRGAGVGGRATACRARADRRRAAGADRAGRRRAGAAGVRGHGGRGHGLHRAERPRRADRIGLPGGRHRRGCVGHARRDQAGRGGHRPRRAGEERRGRRHLAGERLPRRGRRHPEPPLLLLVRARGAGPPTSASATRCSAYLRDVADAHDLRERHPVRHRGGERGSYDDARAGPSPPPHGDDPHRGRRDHRRRSSSTGRRSRHAGPGRRSRARCSTPRGGPRTSTSPATRGGRRSGASAMQIVPAIAERAAQRHGVPALAAVGRARTTCTSPQSTSPRTLLMEHVPFYRALVPRTAVLELGRPGPRRACRRTPSGSTPSDRSTPSTTRTAGSSPGTGVRARRAGRPDREGAAGLPALRQADAARQRLVRGAAPRRRRPDHRRPSPRSRRPGVRGDDGTETEADVSCCARDSRPTKPCGRCRSAAGTGGRSPRSGAPEDADAHLGHHGAAASPNLFLTCGPGTCSATAAATSRSPSARCATSWRRSSGWSRTGSGRWRCCPRCTPTTPRRHDAAHARMIWTHPGMTQLVPQPRGPGRVRLPWRIVDYWRMTRHVDWNEYAVESRVSPRSPVPS